MKRKYIEYIMATNLCQFSIISFDICRFKHLCVCVSSIVNAQHGVGINCFSPRLNNMSYKNQQRNHMDVILFLTFFFWEFAVYQYQKKYNLHKIRWVTIRSSTIIALKSRNSTRTHKQLYTLMIKKEKQLFNKYTWRLVIPFWMEGNVFMFFSVVVEKREVKIVKMSIYIFWYEKYVYEYKFVYMFACLWIWWWCMNGIITFSSLYCWSECHLPKHVSKWKMNFCLKNNVIVWVTENLQKAIAGFKSVGGYSTWKINVMENISMSSNLI